MGRRALGRAFATLAASVVGAVLLSGSDQPVTAHPYPRWQQLATPPFALRVDAVGVHVGHRVLLLGGVGADGSRLTDGATYDLRTGSWRRLRTPVRVTAADRVVAAAGIAVLRHARPGGRASWWRYDPRLDAWSRMRHLPAHLAAPSAFGSEVYAPAGPRIVVYSVQLDRWTPLPVDPLRPALTRRSVTASRSGTVVTGYAGHRLLTDRWDGVRWRRSVSTRPEPVRAAPDGSTRVLVGGRMLVVRADDAWIRLP